MISVPLLVCVMAAWCAVYLTDTLLRVKVHDMFCFVFEEKCELIRATIIETGAVLCGNWSTSSFTHAHRFL